MLRQWKLLRFEVFRRLSKTFCCAVLRVDRRSPSLPVAPGGLLRHGVLLGGGQLRRLPRRTVPRRPGHRAVTGTVAETVARCKTGDTGHGKTCHVVPRFWKFGV